MSELNGTISRVLYRNEQSGWCVVSITDSADQRHVLVGTMPEAVAGLRIDATGSWGEYQGEPSFRVASARFYQPQTERGIVSFLASDAVAGVGRETAKAVVAHFGADALRIMRESPQALTAVSGVGSKRAGEIAQAVTENAARLETMVFLHEWLGEARAHRVYEVYGTRSLEVVRSNPYQIIGEVDGLAFKTADSIGQGVGFAGNSAERTSAGIRYILDAKARRGHTACTGPELLKQGAELLGLPAIQIGEALREMVRSGALVSYHTSHRYLYALPAHSAHETTIAIRLRELVRQPSNLTATHAGVGLAHTEIPSRFPLNEIQSEAVRAALVHKVLVITGGPGTGKTTVLDSICQLLDKRGVLSHLCAPTGIAARRMRDSTNADATTIHRLLEFDPIRGFARNSNNPLTPGVVIVDESSMCDARILSALTQAMTPRSHLILIGDSDQLPSVGPGCVLRDIIESRAVPVMRLDHEYRFREGSRIRSLARTVRAGHSPKQDSGDGVFFEPAASPSAIVDRVVERVSSFLRNSAVDVRTEVQVITPRNRGALSVRELNNRLQRLINPAPGVTITRNGYTFAVGDKVMQLSNDSERELSNGDIGRIDSIASDGKSAVVVMPHGHVSYSAAQLSQLVLGYAVTAHKSQGNEFANVILAVDRSSTMLFDRTLLYTAITRAKECLFIIGDGRLIRGAVRRDESLARCTTLCSRLARLPDVAIAPAAGAKG